MIQNGSPTTAFHVCAFEYKFTGKERDTETGLDYFGARYYASNMGRWMSPDWADKPEAVPYSDLNDPQSLNLYGYVRNNPLSKIDPDGHNLIDWIVNKIKGNPPPPPPPVHQQPPKPNKAALSKQGVVITYSQSTGKVQQLDPAGNKKDMGTGYAGHGQGLNDPQSQSVGVKDDKNNPGPLPQGQYTIGKQQDNVTGNGTELPGSMRLTPSSDNQMYGRDGFLIHGDNSSHNQSASEGCIVLDRSSRNAVGSSGIKTLEVEE